MNRNLITSAEFPNRSLFHFSRPTPDTASTTISSAGVSGAPHSRGHLSPLTSSIKNAMTHINLSIKHSAAVRVSLWGRKSPKTGNPALGFKLGQTVANKRHHHPPKKETNNFRAHLEVSPTRPRFAVAPQAMPPLPTRPGVEPEMLRARAGNMHWSPNPGPPKPHVRAGRAPEPRPKPGHLAAGSPPRARASPGARCPGSPRSPQRGPTTARDSPPPRSPAAPRGLLLVPCSPEPRAPKPRARPHSLQAGRGGWAGRCRRPESASARTSEPAPGGGGSSGRVDD